MISRGTSIEFTVQGSTGEWIPRTVDDLRSNAIDEMSADFVVNSVGITRTSNSIFREYWDWGYSANVRATTIADHAGIAELIKVVSDAFASASGEPCTVQATGYGAGAYPSGQPGGTTEPRTPWGLGLGVFGLLAIAVAIVVWKKT